MVKRDMRGDKNQSYLGRRPIVKKMVSEERTDGRVEVDDWETDSHISCGSVVRSVMSGAHTLNAGTRGTTSWLSDFLVLS